MLSLLAAFFYGVAAVLTKIGVVSYTSPIVGVAIALLTGTVVMLPAALKGPKAGMRGKRSAITYLLLAGVCSGTGATLYYVALATAKVTVATSITSANPLVTIMLTQLFFRRLERITPRIMMGAVLVVGGVILTTLGRNTP